jgi:hypothetical protein
MSLWLSDDELTELTGYKQRDKRLHALTDMSVKFRVRPADLFILVERHLFEGGQLRKHEPNFAALRSGNGKTKNNKPAPAQVR